MKMAITSLNLHTNLDGHSEISLDGTNVRVDTYYAIGKSIAPIDIDEKRFVTKKEHLGIDGALGDYYRLRGRFMDRVALPTYDEIFGPRSTAATILYPLGEVQLSPSQWFASMSASALKNSTFVAKRENADAIELAKHGARDIRVLVEHALEQASRVRPAVSLTQLDFEEDVRAATRAAKAYEKAGATSIANQYHQRAKELKDYVTPYGYALMCARIDQLIEDYAILLEWNDYIVCGTYIQKRKDGTSITRGAQVAFVECDAFFVMDIAANTKGRFYAKGFTVRQINKIIEKRLASYYVSSNWGNLGYYNSLGKFVYLKNIKGVRHVKLRFDIERSMTFSTNTKVPLTKNSALAK